MAKNVGGLGLNGIQLKLAPMAIENKILGAVLELPANQHYQFSPFGPFLW